MRNMFFFYLNKFEIIAQERSGSEFRKKKDLNSI